MTKAIVLLLCSAAIAGCHGDSGQVPAAAPAAPGQAVQAVAARKPVPKESTAGMVEAAVQGKLLAPVSLKFDLSQRPAVGQALEMTVALLPQADAALATIDVSGSAGLQLAPGDEKVEFPSVAAGQIYRHGLVVTPTAEGVLFMTLSVHLKHDEITETSVFSVPIIVGELGASDQAGAAKPKN